jgi:hypothetical protein
MQPTGDVSDPRTPDAILAEVLDLVRETGRLTTWRTEKMLKMLHRIYEKVLHEKTPSLAALRKIVDSSNVTKIVGTYAPAGSTAIDPLRPDDDDLNKQ